MLTLADAHARTGCCACKHKLPCVLVQRLLSASCRLLSCMLAQADAHASTGCRVCLHKLLSASCWLLYMLMQAVVQYTVLEEKIKYLKPPNGTDNNNNSSSSSGAGAGAEEGNTKAEGEATSGEQWRA
eukprot:scaffold250737_cov28-Tisochrysis_lutea.AAC.1